MSMEAFEIGGQAVSPGESLRLDIPVARLPTQQMLSLPVKVLHGTRPGPRLWLSAAIHGDEVNGVEIIRRVLEAVPQEDLRGTLVAVPIVNVFGFVQQSRYLPDRRDLNRSFPGIRQGSLAARLARLFLTEVVERCSHGIDLHTGSLHRSNLPQVRGDLDDPETRRCARAFAAPVMLGSTAPRGSLRAVAARRRLPYLLYEAGQPLRMEAGAVEHGVAGILRTMAELDMIDDAPAAPGEPVLLGASRWVRARRSGILRLEAELGQQVSKGESVGVIYDAFGDSAKGVRVPDAGLVIGLSRNPMVNRGDAILHLGIPERDGLPEEKPRRRSEPERLGRSED